LASVPQVEQQMVFIGLQLRDKHFTNNLARQTQMLQPRGVRYREVPGSNFGPKTSYHDRFFVVFLSPFSHMQG
jgi:hypothetical protein